MGLPGRVYPKLRQLVLFLATFAMLQACSSTEKAAPVRIAAAANVAGTLKAIAADFEVQTGLKCEIVSSSSGKLTAQIMEGAPFDLLVSADQTYPDALYRDGRTTAAPRVYAYGKLVLWSPFAPLNPQIEQLSLAEIRHIAMAEPTLAPYGNAALQSLKYYGLEQALQSKLIFGESIAQVNQFVASGAAEYGFTSLSTVMGRPPGDQGSWIRIDKKAYAPIAQAACLIQSEGGPSESAIKFYTYLFSDAARQILKNHGYDLP